MTAGGLRSNVYVYVCASIWSSHPPQRFCQVWRRGKQITEGVTSTQGNTRSLYFSHTRVIGGKTGTRAAHPPLRCAATVA